MKLHSLHLAGFDRRTEKIKMSTYQETNAGAGSTQEVMKVQYTAKTHTSGVGAAASPAVMMAA
jgi:hypothetical protein